MKFKDCFVGEDGNVWRASSLIKASKDFVVFSFDVSSVDQSEILRWKLVNLHDYLNHSRRVYDANLTTPIILRSDGYIMNGWHRVIKALYLKVKYLPAKQFKVDLEPDFSVEDSCSEEESI
ncbi:MAG: hypothetical protein FVQ80_06655 [Planctomycetes bacterium]|nr:hypothetical protein [Planctomycetota bacterium]